MTDRQVARESYRQRKRVTQRARHTQIDTHRGRQTEGETSRVSKVSRVSRVSKVSRVSRVSKESKKESDHGDRER